MKNPFMNSNTNKRYYTWNYYLKQKFQQPVYKVALQSGQTCPNRDGTCGVGGCTFCDEGSGTFAGSTLQSLSEQFEEGKQIAFKKYKNPICVPYFQSYSNTYAPLLTLKEMFDPFAKCADIPMLCIATRSDCLSDDIITYLDSLSDTCEIWLELGLQSIHDESAKRLHRGHTYAQFEQTIQRLSKTRIHICVHVINSLPYESEDMMQASIDCLAHLPIHALKLHMLHILEGTQLAQEYIQSPFPLLTKDAYIDLVIKQLEHLPQHIILQRLTGDGDKTRLIAPLWTTNKRAILNDIDKEMVKRNTYQGRLFQT